MKIKRIILHLLIILFFGIVYFLNIKDTKFGFNFDDSKIVLQYEIANKHGTLAYKEAINEQNHIYGIYPQGGTILSDYSIISRGFFGDKLPYLALGVLISDIQISILIQQIISVIVIAFGLYGILINMSNKKKQGSINNKALLFALLVTLSPTIISFSNIIFPQLIIGSIFITSLYFYANFNFTKRSFFLTSFFTGVLIGMHFSFFLIAIGYFTYILFKFINTKTHFKALFSGTALGILGFLAGISPSLIRNNAFYGNPIANYYNSYVNPYNKQIEKKYNVTGSSKYKKMVQQRGLKDIVNFYILNPQFRKNHLTHLHMFVLGLPLSNIYAFLGIIAALITLKSQKYKYLIISMIPTYILMAGLNDYFGYGDPYNIRSSIHRYLFPFFLTMSVVGVDFFFFSKKYIILRIFVIFFSFSIIFSKLYPNLLYADYRNTETQQEKRITIANYVQQNTTKKDIIFVNLRDYGFLGIDRKTYDISNIDIALRNKAINGFLSNISNGVVFMIYKDGIEFQNTYLTGAIITSSERIPKNTRDYLFIRFTKPKKNETTLFNK